jgi:UDP-GlcNAc:undecaprenyl-phosphate GlcNAc-1-phosphate transferase
MLFTLIAGATFSLLFGLAAFRFSIPLAHRWHLYDVPTSRRRHTRPMPIVGGATIFVTLAAATLFYGALNPHWLGEHAASLLSIGASTAILVALGLIDDLHGTGPAFKLFVQFLAASIVLAFEPNVHQFCVGWSQTMGPITWPTAAFWLVGLSNAINLVDGLDGLAGGISVLVAGSLAALLSTWAGSQGQFGMTLMILFIPACVAFLKHNWHPANIFLGDNGSLPIGFLLGVVSIMSPAQEYSWSWLISITIMMGYPILDMGVCTLRRLRKGNPIFKADRTHLHHRIMRLGLSVSQTCLLLLNVSLYLQLTALSLVKIKHVGASVLYIAAIGLSVFTFLFLMRAIERARAERLAKVTRARGRQRVSTEPEWRKSLVAKIDLEPLYEAGLFEERGRVHQIVSSLQLMLQTMIRKTDTLYMTHQKLFIVFTHEKNSKESIAGLSKSIREKLALFQTVYNIQYSMSALPIDFESQEFLVYNEDATDSLDRAA